MTVSKDVTDADTFEWLQSVLEEYAATDSDVQLAALLGRPATDDEEMAWRRISPALRNRSILRIQLLRRWTGERGGLTAPIAAAVAGVSPNRFYQMVSAWRAEPGLAAAGVYAFAPSERPGRIAPEVNAALQSAVVPIVAAGGGKSVEALRRELEQELKARVPDVGTDHGPRMPSPKTVRAVISREQARTTDLKMLGESLVLDCCPTAMQSEDGQTYDLFAVIDRGTLRILGHSIGRIDDSVSGYRQAATLALESIAETRRQNDWAIATRRIDVVVGLDADEMVRRVQLLDREIRWIEIAAITRPKRFGSQFRKYVGERLGGMWLRPTWALRAPPRPSDPDQTFTPSDARVRAAREIDTWNARKLIQRDGGDAIPPAGLLAALNLLAATD